MRLDDQAEFELVEAPPDVLVGLVTELTLAAWALQRRPIPDYARADMPGRLVRLQVRAEPGDG